MSRTRTKTNYRFIINHRHYRKVKRTGVVLGSSGGSEVMCGNLLLGIEQSWNWGTLTSSAPSASPCCASAQHMLFVRQPPSDMCQQEAPRSKTGAQASCAFPGSSWAWRCPQQKMAVGLGEPHRSFRLRQLLFWSLYL